MHFTALTTTSSYSSLVSRTSLYETDRGNCGKWKRTADNGDHGPACLECQWARLLRVGNRGNLPHLQPRWGLHHICKAGPLPIADLILGKGKVKVKDLHVDPRRLMPCPRFSEWPRRGPQFHYRKVTRILSITHRSHLRRRPTPLIQSSQTFPLPTMPPSPTGTVSPMLMPLLLGFLRAQRDLRH